MTHSIENPLNAFQKEIERWPFKQATVALLLLKAALKGDQAQIDALYPELTASQLEAVERVAKQITGGEPDA